MTTKKNDLSWTFEIVDLEQQNEKDLHLQFSFADCCYTNYFARPLYDEEADNEE